MRVRAFPFGEEVEHFLAAHQLLFVVEQNRDAQFRSLLTLETARGEDEAALAAALQRPADLLDFIVEGRAGRSAAADPKQAGLGASWWPHDLPRQTQSRAIPRCRGTRSGFTRRDYEGALSTLCAGCGHDSITAAIVEAAWGIDLEPQNLVKLSGIGCSSKTTAYFVSGGHGFNSVHGRMPSIAHGRERREPRAARTSASRATATRCRSASASSATPSAAISTCCTSSRTTACTA